MTVNAERPRTIAIVPAFEAERTIAGVVRALMRELPGGVPVLVVDDGSRDQTERLAREEGAIVVRHAENQGKGAAITTGLKEARALGFDVALTVDADGQHPAESAREVLEATDDPDALVLGVRDLARANAPRANRCSNAISNFFLSRLLGVPLSDTQCGLRRYPVGATLALGARSTGYAFEAEVLMRAKAAGMRIVEAPIRVLYPPDRTTHFHNVRDPARIVARIVVTRRELLLSLGALAIARTARADSSADLESALARVANARASLRSLVGPFTQERTIGLLATSVKSTGTMTLVAPDRLRWELGPPDDVVYWIGPEGLAYRSRHESARIGRDKTPLAGALDDLRTLLGGDLRSLTKRYDLRVVSTDPELAFEARPRNPKSPFRLLTFALARDLATPIRAELVEGPRDKTTITFGALARDVKVDPSVVRPPS